MDKRKNQILTREEVLSKARAYKSVISDIVPNSTVYLFGSYSKGTANQDSDIDIAVVVPEFHGDWWDTAARLWGATREVDTMIEPVLIDDRHDSPLYEDIKCTGLKI